MNHVKEANAAFQAAVIAAAAAHRPFEVWPRDQHRLTLENIPVILAPEEFESRLNRTFWVSTDEELQIKLRASLSYGILSLQRDKVGALLIGEYARP